MAAPSWFNRIDYFNNKLNTLPEGWDSLGLAAAFKASGYDPADADALYQHYLDFGQYEGLSATKYFNVNEYLYAKAKQAFPGETITANHQESMLRAMNASGMTAWEHYLEFGAAEGLNPSNAFDAIDYLQAQVNRVNNMDPAPETPWTVDSYKAALAASGYTPLTHYLDYGINEMPGYEPQAAPIDAGIPGETIAMTEGRDSKFGTAYDDTFTAEAGDLQSYDYIDGLGGTDWLVAYLESNDTAIYPQIKNVEKIEFRAQQKTQDAADNNPAQSGKWVINVDAGRIQGMDYLHNNWSRADMAVEQIMTDSSQMTIALSNTDPGGVDFGVFFDPQHITGEGQSSTGTLFIRLMDVTGADETNDASPLLNNPYDQLAVLYKDELYNINLAKYATKADYTGATANYISLAKAFNDALKFAERADGSTVDISGTVKATPGDPFRGEGTVDGVTWTSDAGQIINLVASDGEILADSKLYPDTGWGATGKIPTDSAFVTTISPQSTVECPLLQTFIELDNVGRVKWIDAAPDCLPADAIFGSTAGDMVVGSMATTGGIERFDITVDRGSWLSSLASTNNTLRMIKVKNGDVQGDSDTANAGGQLFIGDALAKAAADGNLVDWHTNLDPRNPAMNPGSWIDLPKLLTTDGLTDVKHFDATGMTGSVNIGAQFTAEAKDKYLADVDGLRSVYDQYAPKGEFSYLFGSGADTLNMVVNGGIAADRDFFLNIDGGAGNDFVNFRFTGLTTGQLNNMVQMGRNHAVKINGGAGNDLVKSWGNGVVDINGGSGNDVVYAGQLADGSVIGPNPNSTEHNAVFVFNANVAGFGNLGKMVYIDTLNGAQPLDNDIMGIGANTYTLVKANAANAITATVSFMGFTVVATLVSANTAATAANPATITYDDLFRAISKAIAEDQTMNALLSVKDGAGNSMIFESLVDGIFTLGGNTSPVITFNNDTTLTNWASENAVRPVEQASDSYVDQWGNDNQPTIYGIDAAFGAATVDTVHAINIDGTMYYTQAALGGTTYALLATALNGARDINGNFLSDKFIIADNGTTITVADKNAGHIAHDITLYQVGDGAGSLIGTNNGTQSINWVDPGVGAITDNNTLILNAHASGADAFMDIIDINGIFGHMDVINFDGANAGAQVDKISVGDLLNITATNVFNAGGALNSVNVAAAVVNNVGWVHAAGNNTGYSTVAEFVTNYTGTYNTATAGIYNVVFVVEQSDSTKYTAFRVLTDSSTTLNASEVTLLGTIDFDNMHGGIASTDLIA